MGLGAYGRKAITIDDLIKAKLLRSETAQRFEPDRLVASGVSSGASVAIGTTTHVVSGTASVNTKTSVVTVTGKKPVLVLEIYGFRFIGASNVYYQIHRGYPGQVFSNSAGTIIYDTSDGGVPNFLWDNNGQGILMHCFQVVEEPNAGTYQWGGVITYDHVAGTKNISVQNAMFVTEID
jgi:hypothetical protein